MLTSVSTEDLIPKDHPIRRIRVVVDAVLGRARRRVRGDVRHVGPVECAPGDVVEVDGVDGDVLDPLGAGVLRTTELRLVVQETHVRMLGGLAEIAGLPLTEKQELRPTVTPENPIGAHLCATPSEIVRIYSTSGTTGAPSYIPLTAGDLDNWVTGS